MRTFHGDFQCPLGAAPEGYFSRDGYYGIKQTSERLFDFASAFAGDDVEKMKKIRDSMQKRIRTSKRL